MAAPNEERKAINRVDTALAMTSEVLGMLNNMSRANSLSFNMSFSPLNLLFVLAQKLGGYNKVEAMIEGIFRHVIAPGLEMAVKAILLTNLKKMVGCSVDARIPDYMRIGSTNGSGISVSVESIDVFGKLNVSPLSTEGRLRYIGVNGVTNVGELVRARDFDAFLWFVMHCGRFQTPGSYEAVKEMYKSERLDLEEGDTTVLTPQELKGREEGESCLLSVGSIYTSSTIATAVTSIVMADYLYPKADTGFTRTVDMVPAALGNEGVNWYADPSLYLKNMLGNISEYNPRDYSKEFAVCNIKYLDASETAPRYKGLADRSFRIKVMQRVYQQNIFNYIKRYTYDDNGNWSFKGHYTLKSTADKPDDYKNLTAEEKKLLVPTYKGLTVYEFNYDYIMSLVLFDGKQILSSLVEGLTGVRIGYNGSLTYEDLVIRERVSSIVEKILGEYDDEASEDCFYKFDNTAYARMLRDAEEKRKKGLEYNGPMRNADYDDIEELLEQYDSEATVDGQVEVMKKVLRKVQGIVEDEETESGFKYSNGVWEYGDTMVDYLKQILTSLVNSVVMSLLSPKVLFAFSVNNQMMGGAWKAGTIDEILAQIGDIIAAVVREVRDLILAEIWKFVISLLEPVCAEMSNLIVKESFESYIAIIRSLIEDCPSLSFDLGLRELGTNIDNVNYADIDDVSDVENDRPKEKCE